jgi:dimethylglycine dehydrogenase
MDVARYGDWVTPAYTNAKVRENYGRRFRIAYPNEELAAARPLRTSPIHDRLDRAHAVWGASYGLEHALWFAPPDAPRVETPTLRRSNAWDSVADECLAVRSGVGLIETTNFAKYEFTGPGARDFLDGLLAGRLPTEGRIALSPMLDERGRIVGDFTVAALPPGGQPGEGRERFLVFGSGAAERYHERWFDAHLPAAGGVRYRSLAADLCGLSVAGPAARDLLASVTAADVSAEAFGFRDIRQMDVEMVPAASPSPVTSATSVGWSRPSCPGCSTCWSTPVVRTGSGCSGCGHSTRYGWRSRTGPGPPSTGASTTRTKPGWACSSNRTRAASSAGRQPHASVPKGRSGGW